MTYLPKFPIERARLQVLSLPLTLTIIYVMGFGWIQLPLPILLMVWGLIGIFIRGMMVMSGTLLVDLCPQVPNQATAKLS